MIGRLKDLTFGRNREQIITLAIKGDFRDQFDQLKDFDVDIEIKRHRKRRSLNANGYAWSLIDKIAAALSQDKETVYRQAIQSIGGVSDMACVIDESVDHLCAAWQGRGIGWCTDTMPSKIDGCTIVILYYGSSSYDTKQMSCLIDHLIQDAKELGIETATPEEIERYKAMWDQK